MSQSVASRRVAALEQRFGEQLFERTSRRAVLTPFGRDMLAAARQLVQAADVLLDEAEAVKHKPWRLAVPAICSASALARLVAEARDHGVRLDLRTAGPARRWELLQAQQVRAALLAVPAEGRPGPYRWGWPGRGTAGYGGSTWRHFGSGAVRRGRPAASGSSRRTTYRTSATP